LYTGLHSRFDFIQTSHPGIFGEFLPNTAAVIPSVRPSAHPFIKSISPRADCSSHWCAGTGTTSVYSPRNLIRFRAEFVQSISTASLSTTALLTWEGALQKIFSLVFPTCSPPSPSANKLRIFLPVDVTPHVANANKSAISGELSRRLPGSVDLPSVSRRGSVISRCFCVSIIFPDLLEHTIHSYQG
jgi:hypothetical protein